MSGLMNFFVAALEEPERFSPNVHVAHEETLPWFDIRDNLKTKIGPHVIDG